MGEGHDCSRAALLLSGLLDGEATADDALAAEQAVLECDRCASLAADMKEMKSRVRSLPPGEPRPELWARLTTQLDEADASRRPASRKPGRRLGWAAAMLIAAAVAGWAALNLHVTRGLDVSELVEWHPSPRTEATLRTSNLQEAVSWAERHSGGSLTPISLGMLGYRLERAGAVRVDGARAVFFRYTGEEGHLLVYQINSGRRPLEGQLEFCPVGPPKVTAQGSRASLAAWQQRETTIAITSTLPLEKMDRLAAEIAQICR